MNNCLSYLAVPYTHSDPAVRQARFEIANKVAGQLMSSGEFVFSPISSSHPITEDAGVPGDWHFWCAFDTAMLARSQKLIVVNIEGLAESVGVSAEIAIAKKLGLSISYAIPITQGKFTFVDEEDFDAVRAFKWSALKNGRRFYAVRNVCTSDGQRRLQYLHRFLLPGFVEVDHKNGDGLNNRRNNLRPATSQQNHQGFKSKAAGKTSKFRGVSWRKERQKWRGHIQVDGKFVHLGSYKNEEDAARAYDTAARKYFGEFASPNFL